MTKDKAMVGPTVSIGQMRLQIPGTSALAGRRVAARVTEALGERAATLPEGLSRRLGQLSLRVEPRDLSEGALTDAIVESVLRSVSRHERGA